MGFSGVGYIDSIHSFNLNEGVRGERHLALEENYQGKMERIELDYFEGIMHTYTLLCICFSLGLGHSRMAAEQRYFSTLSFNGYANSLACCSSGRRSENLCFSTFLS